MKDARRKLEEKYPPDNEASLSIDFAHFAEHGFWPKCGAKDLRQYHSNTASRTSDIQKYLKGLNEHDDSRKARMRTDGDLFSKGRAPLTEDEMDQVIIKHGGSVEASWEGIRPRPSK